MEMDQMYQALGQALLSDYGNARGNIFPRLLTDGEYRGMDGAQEGHTVAWHLGRPYELVADLAGRDTAGCFISSITQGMLREWGITPEGAFAQAVTNLEGEFPMGACLTRHCTEDVFEGKLVLYRFGGLTARGARYEAAAACSEWVLRNVYSELGAFYLYQYGAGEVCLARACDLSGHDARIPLWWGRTWPPRVPAPVLLYDGNKASLVQYNLDEAPPKRAWPLRERVLLTEDMLGYI